VRTGQILEISSLAKDIGISPNTAKEWISVLEDSFLLRLVHPYYNNRNKRLIKSPKLYFLDAGLCAYLAGWRDAQQLAFGPMAGAFFETHVFGQILRHYEHHHQEVQIHFWRTKDGEEIDFLVEAQGRVIPIEAKINPANSEHLVNLEKRRRPSWQNGIIVSSRSGRISYHGWTRVVELEDLPKILSNETLP
jgi:predicted AAA+ superfamily ATPase